MTISEGNGILLRRYVYKLAFPDFLGSEPPRKKGGGNKPAAADI